MLQGGEVYLLEQFVAAAAAAAAAGGGGGGDPSSGGGGGGGVIAFAGLEGLPLHLQQVADIWPSPLSIHIFLFKGGVPLMGKP